jgi:DNA-directed RNA polymerase subunit beta'
MMKYREFDVKAPDYQPMTFYSSDADEDPAAWLSSIHGTYGNEPIGVGGNGTDEAANV